VVVFQAALELVQHATLARIAAGVDVAQALREEGRTRGLRDLRTNQESLRWIFPASSM